MATDVAKFQLAPTLLLVTQSVLAHQLHLIVVADAMRFGPQSLLLIRLPLSENGLVVS